jgi:lysophospholipase L1-like esterase
MERIKVACLGDSITKGTFSYNWIEQLAAAHDLKDYKFMNFGKNGDLAYNAYLRVDEVIAAKPDHIIILIGTNDVNAIMTPANTKRYMVNKGLPQKPGLEWYVENLEMMIVKLQQYTDAKIAVSTLPLLGEDLTHEANITVARYNAEIERISKEYEIELLYLNSKMADYLVANSPKMPVPYKKGPGLLVKAAIRRVFLRQDWNDISEGHGLVLTTDTIHLNETSGRMLADMALNFIAGPAGSFFWPRPSAEMYERYRMQFSF